MSKTHTIELGSIEARWLLDAIRWQEEYAEKQNLIRNKNKLSALEGTVREQLPEYAELSEEI